MIHMKEERNEASIASKVVDTLILLMFIFFNIAAVLFIVYAGYTLIHESISTTITSVVMALICFWLSVFIAKVFQT